MTNSEDLTGVDLTRVVWHVYNEVHGNLLGSTELAASLEVGGRIVISGTLYLIHDLYVSSKGRRCIWVNLAPRKF